MAIDTTDKALNLATRLVAASTDLMNAVRTLSALNDEFIGTGIQYAPDGVPMDFSGTSLKHIDGNDVLAILTSAAATADWLSTSFNDNNFDKARR